MACVSDKRGVGRACSIANNLLIGLVQQSSLRNVVISPYNVFIKKLVIRRHRKQSADWSGTAIIAAKCSP